MTDKEKREIELELGKTIELLRQSFKPSLRSSFDTALLQIATKKVIANTREADNVKRKIGYIDYEKQLANEDALFLIDK